MSRLGAIETAVRLQLLADRKAIAYNNVFGPNLAGPPAVTGYAYDKTSFRRFLLAVADRLKGDEPPVILPWRLVDVDECLVADHYLLVNLLADYVSQESNTTP